MRILEPHYRKAYGYAYLMLGRDDLAQRACTHAATTVLGVDADHVSTSLDRIFWKEVVMAIRGIVRAGGMETSRMSRSTHAEVREMLTAHRVTDRTVAEVKLSLGALEALDKEAFLLAIVVAHPVEVLEYVVDADAVTIMARIDRALRRLTGEVAS